MAIGNPGMADGSARSTRRGRRPTGATAPVSPAHALEMLASAVNYLRGSGLNVVVGNSVSHPGGVILVVAVHGAKHQHGAFVLADAGKGDADAPTG